jgi:hypothetical protein
MTQLADAMLMLMLDSDKADFTELEVARRLGLPSTRSRRKFGLEPRPI